VALTTNPLKRRSKRKSRSISLSPPRPSWSVLGQNALFMSHYFNSVLCRGPTFQAHWTFTAVSSSIVLGHMQALKAVLVDNTTPCIQGYRYRRFAVVSCLRLQGATDNFLYSTRPRNDSLHIYIEELPAPIFRVIEVVFYFSVSWIKTPCRLGCKYQRFEETYCLHLQDIG
jgi:hypothetical protein